MTFTPHGKHLIAGEWLAGEGTFQSSPAQGTAHAFSGGTVELVSRACEAAEAAFATYSATTRRILFSPLAPSLTTLSLQH